MKTINDVCPKRANRPVKVIQFGEGNFLRAFVDYMIDCANEKDVFDSNVAVVVPIASFKPFPAFKEQDYFYTVMLRGRQNGKVLEDSRIISCVEKVLSSGEEHSEYLKYAESEDLRFVVSNTTEAGIVYDANDKMDDVPASFPGKVTEFLYKRYKAFNGAPDKGLIFLPVELIEANGTNLKKCILLMAENWGLEKEFSAWVEKANVFCNTLVDRIVTGYPANAKELCEKLGYTDNLLDVAEPFGLWVIESETDISKEFPLDKAGMPVIFTDNLKPYRDRKVRVLNGAHTALTPISYLIGKNIVRDSVQDELIGSYVNTLLNSEILPGVALPKAEVEEFIAQVLERFDNPTIDHLLLSIALNTVSKWKARLLCSFKDFYKANNEIPALITFSFAGMLAFYTSDTVVEGKLICKRADGTEYALQDDAAAIEFFAKYSTGNIDEFVSKVCKNVDFWGEDLSEYEGFEATVKMWLKEIRENGAENAMRKAMNK